VSTASIATSSWTAAKPFTATPPTGARSPATPTSIGC